MSLELELENEIKRQMQEAIQLARGGDKAGAESILTRVLSVQPDNEDALVWRAAVTEDRAAAVRCLEKALKINPENRRAQAGLEWARKRLQEDEGPVEIKPAAPAYIPPQPKSLPSIVPELPSKRKNETKAQAAPYKQSRFNNSEPALVLPPEALPQENYPEPSSKRSRFSFRRPSSANRSRLINAATPRIALTISETVARGARTGSRRADRVKIIWPLLLFGLALGVALLTFLLPSFAPLLGITALLVAVAGVLLFDRAEF